MRRLRGCERVVRSAFIAAAVKPEKSALAGDKVFVLNELRLLAGEHMAELREITSPVAGDGRWLAGEEQGVLARAGEFLDRFVTRQVVVGDDPIVFTAIGVEDETAAAPFGDRSGEPTGVIRPDIEIRQFYAGNEFYENRHVFGASAAGFSAGASQAGGGGGIKPAFRSYDPIC